MCNDCFLRNWFDPLQDNELIYCWQKITGLLQLELKDFITLHLQQAAWTSVFTPVTQSPSPLGPVQRIQIDAGHVVGFALQLKSPEDVPALRASSSRLLVNSVGRSYLIFRDACSNAEEWLRWKQSWLHILGILRKASENTRDWD